MKLKKNGSVRRACLGAIDRYFARSRIYSAVNKFDVYAATAKLQASTVILV